MTDPTPEEQIAIDILNAADPVTEEDFRELTRQIDKAIDKSTVRE